MLISENIIAIIICLRIFLLLSNAPKPSGIRVTVLTVLLGTYCLVSMMGLLSFEVYLLLFLLVTLQVRSILLLSSVETSIVPITQQNKAWTKRQIADNDFYGSFKNKLYYTGAASKKNRKSIKHMSTKQFINMVKVICSVEIFAAAILALTSFLLQ